MESTDFDFKDLQKKKGGGPLVVLVLTGVSGSGILFSCCYLLKNNTHLSFSMKTLQKYPYRKLDVNEKIKRKKKR